jgi:hypothetical protein
MSILICDVTTEPSVIAEVITGILLGPSVMGFVPGFTTNIFPTTSITIFNGVSPRQSIAFRKKKDVNNVKLTVGFVLS